MNAGRKDDAKDALKPCGKFLRLPGADKAESLFCQKSERTSE
jgi:hypothetical protein